MEKVLVVGLGEVGKPIFLHIRRSGHFEVYGYDTKKTLPPVGLPDPPIDYLHICIPYSEAFGKIVIEYVRKYQPKLTIIHSTVPPNTTAGIATSLWQENFPLMVHSPVRGMHNDMYQDLAMYVKFIGPTCPRAAVEAKKHLQQIGFTTKVLGSAEETELGKLFETTYAAGMIAIWQEMERVSRTLGIDFVNATEIVRDTDDIRKDRPMWYPDVIGGHCLIPNLELLMDAVEKHRPKPSTVLLLNIWRSNHLTKATPPPEETLEKMKELFKKSRKVRK
jgi:UDP-N-acetyl-D-mannosaminuronate dehydrogenase